MGVSYKPADVRYVHDQPITQSSWVVLHNLGKFPGVTLVDESLRVIEGDVQHVSLNRVDITFAVPVAGKAFLS
jgi:hypothetical protein